MENKKSISSLGALALSIGTAIGWGSFAVTSSSFLSKSGPLGSIIGLLLGMVFMLVIAYSYHYLMNKFPNTNGGIYSYAKNTLGGDHAFMVSWLLIITYLALLWANVSSLTVFSRHLFGSTFQFGFHYTLWGYEIWFGELLLCLVFLAIFGGICFLKKKITSWVQMFFVILFVVIIFIGFFTAAIMHQGGFESFKPDFALNGDNEFMQILNVISMIPWAFIGFESISNSAKDIKTKNTFKILAISVIITTLLYLMLCLLSISVFPSQYGNWYEYLKNIDTIDGLNGIPAFYVIHEFLGTTGVILFSIALFAIIVTSIIGNLFGLSNLVDTMSEDSVLPKIFSKKNKWNIPFKNILIILLLTAIMLFSGRVFIGFIVDVTSFSGCVIFVYVGIIVLVKARRENYKKGFACGIMGLSFGIFLAISIFLDNVLARDGVSKEPCIVLTVWATVGFIYYFYLLRKDKENTFGNSMAALFGLLLLVLYSTSSWLILLVKSNAGQNELVVDIYLITILLVATQVVFFLVFSRIKRREIETRNKLVLGMAAMVESRDNSTGGHIKRTSDIVSLIVQEIKKDENREYSNFFYSEVVKAAPMHDLGKIAIDDAILRKPGKFTIEEYETMKGHSTEGARIVTEILSDTEDASFKEVAINIAHFHHERWDGGGYPLGLKGEDIPLEARIMSLADVYDALVSKRVYKEEYSFEEANRIILENMGKQFDPRLEKYYLQARDKIEDYYRKLKEEKKDR